MIMQVSNADTTDLFIVPLLQAGCFEVLQTLAIPFAGGSPARLRAQVSQGKAPDGDLRSTTHHTCPPHTQLYSSVQCFAQHGRAAAEALLAPVEPGSMSTHQLLS